MRNDAPSAIEWQRGDENDSNTSLKCGQHAEKRCLNGGDDIRRCGQRKKVGYGESRRDERKSRMDMKIVMSKAGGGIGGYYAYGSVSTNRD
jgi:hypothetical protein